MTGSFFDNFRIVPGLDPLLCHCHMMRSNIIRKKGGLNLKHLWNDKLADDTLQVVPKHKDSCAAQTFHSAARFSWKLFFSFDITRFYVVLGELNEYRCVVSVRGER